MLRDACNQLHLLDTLVLNLRFQIEKLRLRCHACSRNVLESVKRAAEAVPLLGTLQQTNAEPVPPMSWKTTLIPGTQRRPDPAISPVYLP